MKHNKCESNLKILHSHYFKFRKGQDKIEYCHYFNSALLVIKSYSFICKKKKSINELDKLISSLKKGDFYSNLSPPLIILKIYRFLSNIFEFITRLLCFPYLETCLLKKKVEN